jgi:hypothetical protein
LNSNFVDQRILSNNRIAMNSGIRGWSPLKS